MNQPFPWLTPDISRMLASLAMPPIDLEAASKTQQRNMEVLSSICLVALDCIQESARRQSALLAETIDQLFAVARVAGANGGPDRLDAQRQLFERGVEAMREISELIAKSNGEALEIVGRRAKDCADEFDRMVGPKGDGG
ncbi:MAG: phasin family protein [Alphaproteobacteria bacterium]